MDSLTTCRLTGSDDLIRVIDLGEHAFCGHFPASKREAIPQGRLSLGWSPTSHLLQLDQDLDIAPMYSDNYGYRSGLNKEMTSHLQTKVQKILHTYTPTADDVIIDIGSNDGTLLNLYPEIFELGGFDPTISKFSHFYKANIRLSADFFNKQNFQSLFAGKKAKIITSISMFYDLPDPQSFVSDIRDCLHPDGLWIFEQSYLPYMLEANSYDTICHEHIEYYSLTVITNLLKNQGLKIVDVSLNRINGGSIEIVAVHNSNDVYQPSPLIDFLLFQEYQMGLQTLGPYLTFQKKVAEHRYLLKKLLQGYNKSGYRVAGIGASTKGNVLLQYCGIDESLVYGIGDINPYKYGRYTPGSLIPILSEDDMMTTNPDILLVLPWHFRSTFINKLSSFLRSGGKLIFPFPNIEIYG